MKSDFELIRKIFSNPIFDALLGYSWKNDSHWKVPLAKKKRSEQLTSGSHKKAKLTQVPF